MREARALLLALSLLISFPARAGGEIPLAEIVGSRVGRFLLSETAEGRRILRFFLGRTSFASADRELFLSRLEEPAAREFREALEARLNTTLRLYERETFRDPMEMRRLPVAEQRRLMTLNYRGLSTSRSYAVGEGGSHVSIRFLEESSQTARASYGVAVEEFLGR